MGLCLNVDASGKGRACSAQAQAVHAQTVETQAQAVHAQTVETQAQTQTQTLVNACSLGQETANREPHTDFSPCLENHSRTNLRQHRAPANSHKLKELPHACTSLISRAYAKLISHPTLISTNA